MFIKLNHKSLDVYKCLRELTVEVHKISKNLPVEERFSMVQQMKRAALSAKLNLAEGCSRRSILERKRFFEISRGSVIEIDSILETAVDLNYFVEEQLEVLTKILNKCFALLTNMMK